MASALTLDQLRVLLTISDTGSFSAAGRKLNRAQSAISQTVHMLEDVQGVQLFDRRGRTPKLTAAGLVLVAEARRVIHQSELFESVARGIAAGLEPEFALAVDSVVPTAPIIECLRGLQQLYPDLPVTLFTENIGAPERRLRSKAAALALCVLLPAMSTDLVALPLLSITLAPVVASNHPLGRATQPVARELLEQHAQLVLTDPLDASGPSFGIVSPRIWRFADLGRRLDFLLAGFGWARMPLHVVAPYLADGRLTLLTFDDPNLGPVRLPIFAVHERERPPGKAARWFLDTLRNQLGEAARAVDDSWLPSLPDFQPSTAV